MLQVEKMKNRVKKNYYDEDAKSDPVENIEQGSVNTSPHHQASIGPENQERSITKK